MTDTKDIDFQPVIDWIAGVAQAGEEFVAREAPALAEEVVRWGVVGNSVFSAVFLLGSLATLIIVLWLWRLTVKMNHDDRDMIRAISFIVGGATIVGLLIGAFYHASVALKAYTAPRLYLVEQIAEVVK